MTLATLILLVGRFLLGGYFLQSGVRNFQKIPLHTSILEKKGVPMPRETLLLGITVEALGGAMVALGIFPALGALALIAFTLAASALYHNFWDYEGEQRATEINGWLSNLALIGGLLVVVAFHL